MNDLSNFILKGKNIELDQNGIYINSSLKDSTVDYDIQVSKKAWTKIYSYSVEELKKDIKEFNQDKLLEVVGYLEKTYSFTDKTVYLEIGCGPAYVGDYILSKYNSYFIGIDFNYEMLLTLKRYFDEMKYSKYVLIYDDINNMPLKDNCIDFIYGGGVIEHFKDTNHILKESYRILKPGGISFNTVPAFNLWWSFRFFNNIPDLIILRNILEFVHIKLLKGEILQKYFGYELSYTIFKLLKLHKNNNFKEVSVLPFALFPSKKKLRNSFLRNLYYFFQSNLLTCAVYLVCGKK